MAATAVVKTVVKTAMKTGPNVGVKASSPPSTSAARSAREVSATKAAVTGWQPRAACRGPHTSVFFPPQKFERKGDRLVREQRAKEICGTCPVATACLDYALAIREPHGIWGGLNEGERRALLPPKPVAIRT